MNIEPANVIQDYMDVYETVTGNKSGSATVKEYEMVVPLNTFISVSATVKTGIAFKMVTLKV